MRKRSAAMAYLVIVILDLLLMVAYIKIFSNGFKMEFYSDAYYTADCRTIQLFYTYEDEDFNEIHSFIASDLTKFMDGYSIDLDGIDIKNIQLMRIDYWIGGNKDVNAREIILKFRSIPIKKIKLNDLTFKECTFHNIEYLGNNMFYTKGIDPYIIFGESVLKEIQDSINMFRLVVAIISALMCVILFVLEFLYRKKIKVFLINFHKTIKEKVVNMHIEIFFSDVLRVYSIVYPVAVIIIGLNWQNKGIDLRNMQGGNWYVIKIVCICSFLLWIKVNMMLEKKGNS